MIYLVHSFSESLSLVHFFLLGHFLKKTSFHCNVKICHVVQKKKTNKKRTFGIKRSPLQLLLLVSILTMGQFLLPNVALLNQNIHGNN